MNCSAAKYFFTMKLEDSMNIAHSTSSVYLYICIISCSIWNILFSREKDSISYIFFFEINITYMYSCFSLCIRRLIIHTYTINKVFVWLWLISKVNSLPVANEELTCKYTVYPCRWVVHVEMTRVMNTVNVFWGNGLHLCVLNSHHRFIEFICSRDFNYVVDCRCIIDKGSLFFPVIFFCIRNFLWECDRIKSTSLFGDSIILNVQVWKAQKSALTIR